MLRVLFSKRPDGTLILRCVRPDGTETWQKQERHAAFFILHDLTHFAIESVLGCEDGFFGLIAKGWDIADTTGKGKRGALPPGASEVEFLTGTFDSERAGSTLWTASEINASLSLREARTRLTDEDVANIRQRRAELFARWASTPEGETLELTFGT